MPSPFKFLDAYTRDDGDQFFGREEEITQLYELVNQNRLVLLYGPSGTGKTSLIQCGLGNRFEATDWLPLFVRRGRHLPTSLQKTLTEKWDEELEGNFWEMDENPLPEIIEDLFAEYLRPVYLVFDQLEEIFILGDEEEQRIFTEAMAEIYHAKLPCRLIFILREEYLAHLYDFEQQIPTLFKRRLRVEAMSATQAAEVVTRSCERFNITLQDPTNNPSQIISKISAGRSGVALPYLQVYLDRLYREDFERTYGSEKLALKGGKGEENMAVGTREWLPLEFTTQEIDDFGELGDVLKIFLQDQSLQIQSALSQQFPGLPERSVKRVLNAFATLQGTKIPQPKESLKVPPVSQAQLFAILEELQKARILREEEGVYELAHDTLAGEIADQRTGAELALLEVTELVQNRLRAFDRTSTYLDAKELQLIENYESLLREEQRLEDKAWAFIQASQEEAKRKRQRRNRITAGVIAVLSVLLVFAGIQNYNANEAREEAEESFETADSLLTVSDSAKEEALAAKRQVEIERKKTQEVLVPFYQAQLENANRKYANSLEKLKTAQRLYPGENGIIANRRREANLYQQEQKRLTFIIDSINSEINR